jgi:uncharacterized membrane protein
MLIVFPLGLYPIALICDFILIGRFLWDGKVDGFWWGMALWSLIFGALMTLAAALPGFVDWLNIPGGAPSKRPATFHLIIGVFFIVPLTIASILLRNWGEAPATLNYGAGTSAFYVAILLNLFMNTLLAFQGWLGGHLVYAHGIGVESSDKIDPIATQVNADEPSLDTRRARA